MHEIEIVLLCSASVLLAGMGLLILLTKSITHRNSAKFSVSLTERQVYRKSKPYMSFKQLVQIYLVRTVSVSGVKLYLRFQTSDGKIWDYALKQNTTNMFERDSIDFMVEESPEIPSDQFQKLIGSRFYGETMFIVGKKQVKELLSMPLNDLKHITRKMLIDKR